VWVFERRNFRPKTPPAAWHSNAGKMRNAGENSNIAKSFMTCPGFQLEGGECSVILPKGFFTGNLWDS
jgi:hypothetical protein